MEDPTKTALYSRLVGLVSLIANRAKGKPQKMKETYGPIQYEFWARLSQNGLWEKTFQDSLPLNLDDSLDKYLAIWPNWGTALGGLAMEQKMLEPVISETDCLLSREMLPTPTHSDHRGAQQIGSVKKWESRYHNLPETIQIELAKDRTLFDQKVGDNGEYLPSLLNPVFVENVMGYPSGWTDLNR
jgi:hypothetical protein